MKNARAAGVVVVAILVVSSCGTQSPSSSSGCTAKTAQSASDCGGLSGLVAAAKMEGQLNVIALPPEWANYGAMIDAFRAKYPGIKVNSNKPNVKSQDEIDAIKAGGAGAPDVVDLSLKAARNNTSLFAPYKVASWNDIPSGVKEATGVWTPDYGGYIGIGYDSAKVPGGTIISIGDLLAPGFKVKVALTGNPTKYEEALFGLIMASVANGGSLDDVGKGVDFFHQLKTASNFVSTNATPATIKAGQTPIVFEWDYLSVVHVTDVPSWKVYVPSSAVIAGYYAQAINKAAPHPAAARLWEEFLYSDEGQNIWLKGGVRPVRQAALEKSGKIDAFAAAALPKVTGKPLYPTAEQQATAEGYLSARWAQAIA